MWWTETATSSCRPVFRANHGLLSIAASIAAGPVNSSVRLTLKQARRNKLPAPTLR